MNSNFQQRIGYNKDIDVILKAILDDYNLGAYESSEIILVGYEDFNIKITTDKGKYFLKIFADFRDENECRRYVQILEKVIEAGVSCPKIIPSSEGNLLIKEIDGHTFRCCMMDHIDGTDFFNGDLTINDNEKRFIIQQAALINGIDIKPEFVYDSWAIVNFEKEFNLSKPFLNTNELKTIEPLINEFHKTNLNNLPHCLVHGDLIKTNIMKDKKGKIYIIDFAVSNYYPRIVELAVLQADMLNDKNDFILLLDEYQKKVKLTDDELNKLPLFTKIANAMHVIRGVREREVNNNHTKENENWINIGKRGLKINN